MRFPEISRDSSTPLGMTNKHASRVVIGTSTINISAYEHEISEESERGNERDDVFPAHDRQDPAARVRRASRRISQKFRDAANCRRRVLQLSAGASSRFVRTGEARRERRRDSGVVLRKRPPPQRRRHHGLERVCFETWLARFHVAAVPRIKKGTRHCRSRRYRVCSRLDGFRGRAKEVTADYADPADEASFPDCYF